MSNSNPRLRVAFVPMKNSFVGIARSIIYNSLYKKACNGTLVLRIDDTDTIKSNEDYRIILDELKSLGLSWDEGPDIGGPYEPYIQSKRGNIYIEHVVQLINKGCAYKCFCKNDKKQNSVCRCSEIGHEESTRRAQEESFCVKFKIAHKIDHIHDLIRGDIQKDTSLITDPVILRSDGTPTFHIATVVDDTMFQITHIMRGADHINGAFIQKQIFEAFGYTVPSFAHFSIFTGKNKEALTIGTYELSLSYLLAEGYPNNAIIEFLTRLGYNTCETKFETNNNEHNTFSFSKFQKNTAIYSLTNLKDISKKHIQKMSDEAFLQWIKCSNTLFRTIDDRILLSQKVRISCLRELTENINSLCNYSAKYVSDVNIIISKIIDEVHIRELLMFTIDSVQKITDWNISSIRIALNYKQDNTPEYYKIIRAIITANKPFGDLLELIYYLGKDKVINKLKLFL